MQCYYIFIVKELFITFLTLSLILNSFPCFAIDGETAVVPIIGNVTEKASRYINDKIELVPIKLPQRISHFELLEAERALIPNLLKDEIGLWTGPLRVKFRDLVWFIPAGGTLTTLLLVDNKFSQVLTDNHNHSSIQDDLSKAFAQIGGYYPVLGLPGGLILVGAISRNDRLRETGILQYEGLANALLVGKTLQVIFGRNKPNNHKRGRGDFFEGSSSFPSGHSISSWTIASIASHQYSDKKWVPILAYSLASVISASRVTQDTHFPSDIFAGALIGYLIGKYVVKHNSKFSPKYSSKDKKVSLIE